LSDLNPMVKGGGFRSRPCGKLMKESDKGVAVGIDKGGLPAPDEGRRALIWSLG
jgi:hypothetical protein